MGRLRRSYLSPHLMPSQVDKTRPALVLSAWLPIFRFRSRKTRPSEGALHLRANPLITQSAGSRGVYQSHLGVSPDLDSRIGLPLRAVALLFHHSFARSNSSRKDGASSIDTKIRSTLTGMNTTRVFLGFLSFSFTTLSASAPSCALPTQCIDRPIPPRFKERSAGTEGKQFQPGDYVQDRN